MSYAQRIQLVKEALLYYCRETITERWNNDFEVWLLLESNDDLNSAYITTFRHHFQTINQLLKHILLVCAANTVIALRSFINSSGTPELEEVLGFVTKFLNEQMSEFDSLCADCELNINEDIY